jgi:hypothetical protein
MRTILTITIASLVKSDNDRHCPTENVIEKERKIKKGVAPVPGEVVKDLESVRCNMGLDVGVAHS